MLHAADLASVDLAPIGASTLSPPAWIKALINHGTTRRSAKGRFQIELTSGAIATFVTLTQPDMRWADADAFREEITRGYLLLREILSADVHAQIVRIWNYLPGIHDAFNSAADRYMVFNAGRFQAMESWFGSAEQFAALVPAGTGVGHAGSELVIHALAVAEAGVAIDNPAQIPSFRYSEKYGPVPPCFARATRVNLPQPTLLIAGTAAIVGEATQFVGDLSRQFDLSLQNLSAVIAQGFAMLPSQSLRALCDIRIYTPPEVDAAVVRRLVSAAAERFNPAANIEYVTADLCRRDLLVEIEGVAQLESTAK